MFACERTKLKLLIAIDTNITFILLLHLVVDKLIVDLNLGYVDLVGIGALAPGAAVTPQQRGPPPSLTSGRGEVAELAGGASRPCLVSLLLPTTASCKYILNTMWEPGNLS